jgi:Transmembrane secretion effector
MPFIMPFYYKWLSEIVHHEGHIDTRRKTFYSRLTASGLQVSQWNTVSPGISSTPSASASKPGISRAWRALRHRNFRLYYGGQSISLIGTWMTRLATSWLVYRLTGSAFLLGVVGFAGQIPTFIFAPFAGVWIDRLDQTAGPAGDADLGDGPVAGAGGA